MNQLCNKKPAVSRRAFLKYSSGFATAMAPFVPTLNIEAQENIPKRILFFNTLMGLFRESIFPMRPAAISNSSAFLNRLSNLRIV